MQEDLAVAAAPRREPCGGRARGAGCRRGWSRRRPPEPRSIPGGPPAARRGWRSAPGLTPSRWKPWWDARPRGRCPRVAMRSPVPAAGRLAEPRRRVGTGGSGGEPEPAPAPAASRAGPCPGSIPSRPLPFVFPAEKRPKAGAESRAGGVQVELQGSELWRRFHDIGTEMIITKAGRYRLARALLSFFFPLSFFLFFIYFYFVSCFAFVSFCFFVCFVCCVGFLCSATIFRSARPFFRYFRCVRFSSLPMPVPSSAASFRPVSGSSRSAAAPVPAGGCSRPSG